MRAAACRRPAWRAAPIRIEPRGGAAIGEQIAAPQNDALRVHNALEVLENAGPRIFGGLSKTEIAEALGLSERTARRAASLRGRKHAVRLSGLCLSLRTWR